MSKSLPVNIVTAAFILKRLGVHFLHDRLQCVSERLGVLGVGEHATELHVAFLRDIVEEWQLAFFEELIGEVELLDHVAHEGLTERLEHDRDVVGEDEGEEDDEDEHAPYGIELLEAPVSEHLLLEQ